MINNSKINLTDLESLSAYIDNQLDQAERQALQSSLQTDEVLRNTLEDLRMTRYALRHTPKVKRQRSFTLTSEMVRQQRFTGRAMNISRMLSAAASILLLVMIGGQMLLGFGAGRAAFSGGENIALMADEAQNNTAEEPMVLEMAKEAGEAAPADDADMGALSLPAEELEEPLEESTQSAETGLAEEPPASETPELQATMPMDQRSIPTEKDKPDSAVEAGLAAAVEGGQITAGTKARPLKGVEPIPTIRILQGGLLLVAVLAALAAAYFRKQLR